MRKILNGIIVVAVFAVMPQLGFAGEGVAGPTKAAESSHQDIHPDITAMRQEMAHLQRRVTDLEEEMRQLKQTIAHLTLQPRPSGLQERQQQYQWRLEQRIQQLEMQIMQLQKYQYGQ